MNSTNRNSSFSTKKFKVNNPLGQVSPDLGSLGELEDEDDFLASSMASQKSVASDAFDFLFDETNLNPEKVFFEKF